MDSHHSHSLRRTMETNRRRRLERIGSRCEEENQEEANSAVGKEPGEQQVQYTTGWKAWAIEEKEWNSRAEGSGCARTDPKQFNCLGEWVPFQRASRAPEATKPTAPPMKDQTDGKKSSRNNWEALDENKTIDHPSQVKTTVCQNAGRGRKGPTTNDPSSAAPRGTKARPKKNASNPK